jgi:hypothetical protein
MSSILAYNNSVGAFNIHRELFKLNYQLNFDGLRRLEARRRYIAVQYPKDIRAKLKDAIGESGYGTVLAMEDEIKPQAILQLYPTEQGDSWFPALAIPRRGVVYGFDEPLPNQRLPVFMTRLRKSSFHGDDTDGALFYHRDSLDYFNVNPYLMSVWDGTSFFLSEATGTPVGEFPSLSNFISDGHPSARPYPPPETKPKTVNEWDGPGLDPDQRNALNEIRLRLPTPILRSASDLSILDAWRRAVAGTYPSLDVSGDLEAQIQLAVSLLEREANVSPPPQFQWRTWTTKEGIRRPSITEDLDRIDKILAEQPTPEIRSKNGRMIRFETDDDDD